MPDSFFDFAAWMLQEMEERFEPSRRDIETGDQVPAGDDNGQSLGCHHPEGGHEADRGAA